MSAETRQAVEVAIRAHIADELPGALVTDWQAIVCSLPSEEQQLHPGHRTYSRVAPEEMPMHVADGLHARMADALIDSFTGPDDE